MRLTRAADKKAANGFKFFLAGFKALFGAL